MKSDILTNKIEAILAEETDEVIDVIETVINLIEVHSLHEIWEGKDVSFYNNLFELIIDPLKNIIASN